ncbi:Rit1 N-terminal domain containing protein [Nitzschia inconspicua]|uniref:Rit1 N-terminal domain containing protein n=1 Tax=Nitzschia inconspicua TaxID=303405 RepID=A0A9K3LU11_9STRA|nr:Rit1 N-terminal domain containing protein [Nitzschia inconspicua]
MAFVAAALMHNTSIYYIGLSNNKITNSGLEVLSSRVPCMKVVKRVLLENNTFDDEGAISLARAIKDNVSIVHVGCDKKIESYKDIRYYADLNCCGRRFVKTFSSFKPSLWPHILQRATTLFSDHVSSSKERQTNALYFLLRQGLPPLQSSQCQQHVRRIATEKKGHNKKKTANRARHRLLSIVRDAKTIQGQRGNLPCSIKNLPLVPNERCGRWYLQHFSTSCYFKSTDGHVNVWELSLKRLNLPLLYRVITKDGGCIIVDSSVRKPLPDSFSRTIPIWAAVLNRIVLKYADELGISSIKREMWDSELCTPEGIVSAEEHAKISSLIETRVETLYKSRAIVDPGRLVRALTKPLKVVWIDHKGNFFRTNGRRETNFTSSDSSVASYFVVVCWNPSCYQFENHVPKKSHVEWKEDPGYYYTPGAADDHESWANCLTPALFWDHHETILHPSRNDEQVEEQIHHLVKETTSVSRDIVEDMGKLCHEQVLAMYCDRVGSLNVWIGSRRASRPPECWVSFDAILNVTDESYFEHTLPVQDGKFYLQLPIKEGKRDKTELERWLPVGLAFLFQHLQKDRRVLVHCAQGKDRSVAVVLVFICFACDLKYPLELRSDFLSWDLALFRRSLAPHSGESSTESNATRYTKSGLQRDFVSRLLLEDSRDEMLSWAHVMMQRDIADGPLFDKEDIRIALQLIRQDREVADPTRSTIQKINRFLMSSRLYQEGMRKRIYDAEEDSLISRTSTKEINVTITCKARESNTDSLLKMADEYEDDGLWEKPAWAKGCIKLKSTGKAEAMKTKGDLAAPITKIRDDKDAMRKIKETQSK